MGSIPYADATSGEKARGEVVRLLRGFGCERVGFMDDYQRRELLLQFVWRGREISLRASAAGWAAAYLRENPWNHRRKVDRATYERKALDQGLTAVNSILRDWVKGQVTAIETGILTFEAAFLPWMLTRHGTPLIDYLEEHQLLPAPRSGDATP